MFTYHHSYKGQTYDEIIDLFEKCEWTSPGDTAYLAIAFKKANPYLNVGQPGRFYDTILHIVVLTCPTLQSDKAAINGTPLRSYRKRVDTMSKETK